jgi:hypothetical protein
VISTPLPHVQPVRQVSLVLALDVERLMHSGKADKATDRIRAILHAAAGLHDDPLLLSQLVRAACRTIAVYRIERLLGMGELSDETCRRLMQHVAAERQENLLLVGMCGNRAGWHHLFGNLTNGRLSLADTFAKAVDLGPPNRAARAVAFLYSYRLPADHAAMLRWFDQICDMARLPLHEQAAVAVGIDGELKAARGTPVLQQRQILSLLLAPAVRKTVEATLRDQAQFASAETALAVERFRLAHGRWPQSLAELCPALLKAVPLDPFTGEPLRFARHDDGVAVYAVGPDLADDGGKILRFRPQGNYDVGFRLYDPDKRNLPPAEEPVRP